MVSLSSLSYVVFDGTTAYVIPSDEFDPENEELIKKFNTIEAACEFCDEYSQDI